VTINIDEAAVKSNVFTTFNAASHSNSI